MLDSSKAIQKSDIPVNIVKGHRDTFAEVRFKCFSEPLEKSKLPHCLKLVNVTAGFKKGAQVLKNNYRPVSIVLILSELFDRLIKKQLSEIFRKILDLSLERSHAVLTEINLQICSSLALFRQKQILTSLSTGHKHLQN